MPLARSHDMTADEFILRDRDFDARIRDSFGRQGFMRHVGEQKPT